MERKCSEPESQLVLPKGSSISVLSSGRRAIFTSLGSLDYTPEGIAAMKGEIPVVVEQKAADEK